ncbi:heat-inducible transcription repressor HrcA [bacterium]|nr:heat-inducible transcription repressor HrcA [bacterium]
MTSTFTPLDNRTQVILETIIINYTNKLEPVSSRKLSKCMNLNISSATIRNIMADLEEEGYLYQPHTSAGRVPTDQAYRYFVKNLIQKTQQLSNQEQRLIRNQFREGNVNEDTLLQEIPRIINRISSYVGVSLLSSIMSLIVRRMHFLKIENERILSIIITDSGAVYQKVLEVEELVDQDDLNKISNYVNETFQGSTISEIRDKIVDLMNHERMLYDILVRRSLSYSKEAIEAVRDDELIGENIFLEGATTIFDLPEFANVQKMKSIFEAFMEKRRLFMLLNEFMKDEGVNVCIGSESNVRNLMDLSFIVSPYKKGSHTVGGLGVIGPKRMPYERMIALIDFLSKLVSTFLTSREVVSLEQ